MNESTNTINESSMSQSEPPKHAAPATPRVYMDDGEFYVSSEEVRIGEKKWKLEDVEYVNVEYNSGWVSHLLIIVFLFVLGLTVSTRFSPFLNTVPLWASVIVPMVIIALITKYLKNRIFDDFTGSINVVVNTTGGGIDIIKFEKYSNYRAITEKFSIAFDSAFSDLISGRLGISSDSVFKGKNGKPTTAYIDIDGNSAYIYNLKFHLEDIEEVFTKTAHPCGIIVFLISVACVLFIQLSVPEPSLKALKLYYIPLSMLYAYVNTALTYYRKYLALNFIDSSQVVIEKWNGGDRGAFRLLERQFSKYNRLPVAWKRRERKYAELVERSANKRNRADGIDFDAGVYGIKGGNWIERRRRRFERRFGLRRENR